MSTEKRKIMLFLTSPDDQELIAEYLASLGYEILTYQEEGWAQADLFILDTKSAAQIGQQVLDLKQTVDTFLPVIVVLGKDDDIDFWLSAGFDDCLRKPFTNAELKANVEILLHLRQQSEELIREGEAKYRAIFEATGTATLIVEEDATIIMANKICLPVTGYSPQELIGTKWTKYVAPESLEMMLRYHKLRREYPERAPSQYEVKLVNKAGEVRRAILQVSMVAGTKQSVVSMLDITERKMAEIELNRQREILQKIFDHIPVMITYFDERGNMKTVNHELVKKLGWSLEEWKTENILAKCYPEPEVLKEAIDFMINKPIGWKDFKTSTKYGTVIDTTWTNILLSDGVSMGIGLDITERKQAEDAIKERENQLQGIFRAAPIGIGVVRDRILLEVNARICEMTGFTPEELIGKNTRIFYPTQKEFEYVGEVKYRQIAEKGTGVVETKWMKKDGSIIDVLLSSTLIDVKDNSKGVIFTVLDITERKQAEEKEAQEQQLLKTINHCQQSFILNNDPRLIFDNLLAYMLEVTDSEYGFIGEVLFTTEGQPYIKAHAITNIAWSGETRKFYDENFKKGLEFYNLKTLFGYTLLTGETVISNDPLRDSRRGGLPKGHPPLKAYLGLPIKFLDKMVAMVGVANRSGGYDNELINFLQPLLNTIGYLIEAMRFKRDSSQAEEKFIKIQKLLNETERMSKVGGWEYDLATQKVTWTDEVYRIHGVTKDYDPSDPKQDIEFYVPEDQKLIADAFWRAIDKGEDYDLELRLINAQGKQLWVRTIGHVERRGEEIIRILGNIADITARKQAEEQLRQASINWNKTFDAIQDGIALLDANQNIIKSNQVFLDFIDKTKEEVIGSHCFRYIHGTDCPIEGCPFVRMKQSKQRETMEMLINGSVCEIMVDPILDENRNIIGAVHIIADITERKKMEEALKESEESYRRLFEDHSAVKLVLDPDSGDIIDANKAAADFYGWSRKELKRMKIQQINILPPEEIKKEIEKARTLKKTYFEFRHRLADGSIRDVKVFSSKVDIKGKDYLHSIIHDVTKEKELEAQLHQSQKLESIGQLAGGVAHDFNNILNVILGYGELVLNKLHHGDPMREEVLQIVEAGRRSMSLTQQLLAFSRKQILQPKILNINESLKAIEGMLRRLIGEDIELTLALAEDLSYVKADQGQIEQIIMNLAVNARDAMPYGGKLIIETTNVVLDESYAQNHAGAEPGDYVMIAVTDTGRGMDRETLSRIFEPFFTTKEKEKGTGLGLATVYGIVKQSGGNIWVYSEPEKGTTFKIYLPAALYEPQLEEKQTDKVAGHKGGGEHIMIVEDEPALRGLFEIMLTELGYRVTVAANGGEALLLVEEKGLKLDLVITDVIMPIMSGAVLIERLRRNQPDIKALYMSGYTDNAIVHHGVLDTGTPFIQKPFNLKDLAVKIERLLRA